MLKRKIDPNTGESEDDFVDRCMGSETMQGEFPDQDQRLAVCLDKFRDRSKVIKVDAHGCGPEERYDGSLGRCVSKQLFDNWSPENELQRLKNEVQKRQHAKNRKRQEPGVGLGSLGNRQVDDRDDPDPFLEEELVMALALSERAFDVADQQVLPLYEEALPDDPSMFNQSKLDDANAEATSIWSTVAWTGALAAVVVGVVERSFRSGEAQISRGIVREAPSVQRVLDNMVAVSQFRTNEFFNTQVIPSIQKKIDDLFVTGAFETTSLEPIRRILDRRLKSVPYWRVVANASASRSYHYGVLKAAQSQGFRGYEFIAVLDERTSEICREVNGRQWFLADAVNKMEMVAGSDDPDEAKRILPWVNVNDIRGQSNDALRDMGVMVPPLHGNCRSTLRPIF